MKAWFGLLGIFGAGLGIGFLAGTRFGREHPNEKPETQTQTQDPAPEPKTPEQTAQTIAVEQGYIPESSEEMNAVAEQMNEYLAEQESPDDDEDEEERSHAESLIEVFIDEALWENETEYLCKKLYYYTDDETIADEDEARIEDPEDFIGTDAIPMMMEMGLDCIFVRNSWERTVYKIKRVNNSYGELVLGMSPDEMLIDEEED